MMKKVALALAVAVMAGTVLTVTTPAGAHHRPGHSTGGKPSPSPSPSPTVTFTVPPPFDGGDVYGTQCWAEANVPPWDQFPKGECVAAEAVADTQTGRLMNHLEVASPTPACCTGARGGSALRHRFPVPEGTSRLRLDAVLRIDQIDASGTFPLGDAGLSVSVALAGVSSEPTWLIRSGLPRYEAGAEIPLSVELPWPAGGPSEAWGTVGMGSYADLGICDFYLSCFQIGMGTSKAYTDAVITSLTVRPI